MPRLHYHLQRILQAAAGNEGAALQPLPLAEFIPAAQRVLVDETHTQRPRQKLRRRIGHQVMEDRRRIAADMRRGHPGHAVPALFDIARGQHRHLVDRLILGAQLVSGDILECQRIDVIFPRHIFNGALADQVDLVLDAGIVPGVVIIAEPGDVRGPAAVVLIGIVRYEAGFAVGRAHLDAKAGALRNRHRVQIAIDPQGVGPLDAHVRSGAGAIIGVGHGAVVGLLRRVSVGEAPRAFVEKGRRRQQPAWIGTEIDDDPRTGRARELGDVMHLRQKHRIVARLEEPEPERHAHVASRSRPEQPLLKPEVDANAIRPMPRAHGEIMGLGQVIELHRLLAVIIMGTEPALGVFLVGLEIVPREFGAGRLPPGGGIDFRRLVRWLAAAIVLFEEIDR